MEPELRDIYLEALYEEDLALHIADLRLSAAEERMLEARKRRDALKAALKCLGWEGK